MTVPSAEQRQAAFALRTSALEKSLSSALINQYQCVSGAQTEREKTTNVVGRALFSLKERALSPIPKWSRPPPLSPQGRARAPEILEMEDSINPSLSSETHSATGSHSAMTPTSTATSSPRTHRSHLSHSGSCPDSLSLSSLTLSSVATPSPETQRNYLRLSHSSRGSLSPREFSDEKTPSLRKTQTASSELLSPRRQPFSPRAAPSSGSLLYQEWMHELRFFQRTAQTALSLCYLFPRSLKKKFSEKEILWMDLLIEKYIETLLNSISLNKAVEEILLIIGKDERSFQHLISKINAPLAAPESEHPLQLLSAPWTLKPPFTSFEEREKFVKFLVPLRYTYRGIYQQLTSEEKKCFDLFLRSYVLETYCRFQEQPFKKALFLAARRHPMPTESAIGSLVKKYEEENRLFSEAAGAIASAEESFDKILALPFLRSDALCDLLFESIDQKESKGLNNDCVGFYSFARAIEMLRKSEMPLERAWAEMLEPECLERYFSSKDFATNLQTLHQNLKFFSPRIEIHYPVHNAVEWMRGVLIKANNLDPVIVANTEEEILLLHLQNHVKGNYTFEEELHLLFSNVVLQRIFNLRDMVGQAPRINQLLENLLKRRPAEN